MNATDRFIAGMVKRIEKHCQRRGMAISRFGREVSGHGALVERIRTTGNVTVETLRRVDDYLDRNRRQKP